MGNIEIINFVVFVVLISLEKFSLKSTRGGGVPKCIIIPYTVRNHNGLSPCVHKETFFAAKSLQM